MKIELIPTEELIKDRQESIDDIRCCQGALSLGITRYRTGRVSDRLESNKGFVVVIDKELERRNESKV